MDAEPAVYVVRHGATEWSSAGRHTSHTDLALTAAGERSAQDAGRLLATLRGTRGAATVLASPLERARRTAELAGLRVDHTEPLLAEWDYGEYEGLTTSAIRECDPGWTVWSHPVPGGETAADVQQRADALVEKVRTLAGDVVLFGHGHFSRVLLARWIGLPSTAGVCFGMDAAAVSVLGAERGVPQLVRHNVPAWHTSDD